MWTWSGNTSGEAYSNPKNLPMVIESFGLVNKTPDTLTVNVYKISGPTQVCIAPNNLQVYAGTMYEGDRQIVLLATQRVLVKTSGSLDYDFTFDDTESI